MNKTKFNIFFAASPLHLICLNEYRKRKGIENFKLILLLHKVNKHALKQIYKTLEILDFKNYYIFWIPKNSLIRFLNELILIYRIKFYNLKNNYRFLIIDFRNTFMHSLRRFFKYSEFILIDDGFYTIVAHNKFLSKNIFLPNSSYRSIRGGITKFLYFGNSYRRILKSPIKLFTIYADEIISNTDKILGKNIIMNNLCELRKNINFENIKFIDEKVFFTGTRMVEKGALKLEEELELIIAVKNYWKKKGKIFYYVGKRSTSKEKLLIFNNKGINTLQFDLPLEIVFTQIKEIPAHICGLGSTLQKSLKLLFRENINCYYIDLYEFFKKSNNNILKIKKNEVEEAANDYSKNSEYITTISLK